MLAMCAAGIAIATDRALGKLGSYLGAMREVLTRHACACPSACRSDISRLMTLMPTDAHAIALTFIMNHDP